MSVFGCASLLKHSHLETAPGDYKLSLLEKFPNIDKHNLYVMSPGHLHGYKKDLVCYDVYYRGTPDHPGITIGLDPCEGEFVEGGVLTTDITSIGLERDEYVDFIVYYFEQFKEREFPPDMPIYKFEFLPVQLANGSVISSFSCVADTDGLLYAGDLTFLQRAELLAKSKSLPYTPGTKTLKPKGMITDLDYLRYVIDGLVKMEARVEEHILNYYYAAVAIRRSMDALDQNEVSQFENPNSHAGVVDFRSEHGLSSSFNIDLLSVTVTAMSPAFDEFKPSIS